LVEDGNNIPDVQSHGRLCITTLNDAINASKDTFIFLDSKHKLIHIVRFWIFLKMMGYDCYANLMEISKSSWIPNTRLLGVLVETPK